jgi:hypothetical protein
MGAAVIGACEACGEDLPTDIGCTTESVTLAGKPYDVVKNASGPCPECGTPTLGAHHRGCPLELCARCGIHLVDCGCMAKMPEREVLSWTIDEEELATMEDAEASEAVDRLVDNVADQMAAIVTKGGFTPPARGELRYQISRTILIEMIRRLVVERMKRTDPSASAG